MLHFSLIVTVTSGQLFAQRFQCHKKDKPVQPVSIFCIKGNRAFTHPYLLFVKALLGITGQPAAFKLANSKPGCLVEILMHSWIFYTSFFLIWLHSIALKANYGVMTTTSPIIMSFFVWASGLPLCYPLPHWWSWASTAHTIVGCFIFFLIIQGKMSAAEYWAWPKDPSWK